MKIVGYSERGAMNALFYGIAQADDKKAFFWEDLFNCPELNLYLKDTWDINNDSTRYKSQITNNLNK